MAISTRDNLVAALAAGQDVDVFKLGVTGQTAGRYLSTFRVAGRPGPATSTPAVTGNTLTSASVGALPFANPAAGALSYLGQLALSSSAVGVALLIDQMVETGGLSGIVTTAQTVGSVALPARAGAGIGVTVGLQCYTALGATASPTVTVSYTNSAGVAGRTATVAGGIPASWAAGQIIPCTLQAGDVGVQSVQSVTSTTSTGTAGNFGVVLYRRIAEANLLAIGSTPLSWAELGLPQIGADACLGFAVLCSGTTSPQIVGSVKIAQG